MIVQLTTGDIQALVAVLGSVGVGSASAIRWATTPTKNRLKNVERQVNEIYTLLIHKTD